MYIVFIVLIFIVSLLIILSVLSQNPKGGMAANFGASNQVMGARQTSSFLEKFTWGLAISLLLLSLGATMSMPTTKIAASKSGIDRAIEQSGTDSNNAFEQFAFPTTDQAATEASKTTEASKVVESEDAASEEVAE